MKAIGAIAEANNVEDWLPRLTPELDLLQYGLHDEGNAMRILAVFGPDIRYNVDRKKWFVWDGTRWVIDTKQLVRHMAVKVMQKYLDQAIRSRNEDFIKFALASHNMKKIEYALSMVQPKLPILSKELDTNPFLLNFESGTLDLTDGSIRSHDRADFISKIVPFPFDREAKCPEWLKLIDRMMDGDKEMIDYLQLVFGYSLTASTREKVIFILFGPGGTGKTSLLTAFRQALGEDYAGLLQVNSLMVGRESNNSTADLADLDGVRFAMSSEPEAGSKLSASKLKRITQGMGAVKARRLYENPFSFQETHKLFLDTNDRPQVPGGDAAVFSRLHAIPCLFPIPKEEVDRSLIGKLKEEAAGILAWAVKGAEQWYKTGLPRPQKVAEAVESWREECDGLSQFIKEQCVLGDKHEYRASWLYTAFRAWVKNRGDEPPTATAFGLAMTQRFGKKRAAEGISYIGIKLKPSEPEEPEPGQM